MKTNCGILWPLVRVLTVLALVAALVPIPVGAAGLAPASPHVQGAPPGSSPSAGLPPLAWQQFVALSQSAHDRLAVPATASKALSAEASDASTVSPMAVQQAKPAAWAAGLPVAEPQLSPTSLPDPDEVVITPQAGGVLQSANGRIRLEFPAGAVAQRTVVRHRPVPPDASTPPELFYLCDLTATVEDSGTPFIRRPLPSPRPRLPAPRCGCAWCGSRGQTSRLTSTTTPPCRTSGGCIA